MDAGEVTVKLTGDASSIESAFLKAGTAAVAFGEILASMAQQAASAGLAILRFPMEAATAAGKSAEQFEQLAQRTGIARDALQGLQVAMAREGLESQALAQGFRTLSGQMVGVQEGTAKSTELFRQLGISTEIVAKGTGPTLEAIADRFAGMADGAEKSRFAVELFGRSGLQLIPILNQGAAGLDAAMKKSAEFGLILTTVQQKDLKTFDDSMDDLQSALKGFTAQVGAAFAPSLTALVHVMTNAVVFAKDTFNAFADAGEKLTIRLGAMVAALDLIGKQLFSFSVFSKDAWKATIDQVKAIDDWARAAITGVDASRKQTTELGSLAKAHLDTATAVQSHIDHQKVLGEQITATTSVAYQERLRISKQFFADLFAAEEEASRVNYLRGPEPGIGGDEAQKRAAEQISATSLVAQQVNRESNNLILAENKRFADADMAIKSATYQQEFSLFADVEQVREAANQQIIADLAIQENTELMHYEDGKATFAQYQNTLVDLERTATAQRMGIARQYPTFFEKQMRSVVESNAFSVGLIINTWTSGVANAIVHGGNFVKAAWESTQVALIQGALNTTIQFLAQQALMATGATVAATTTTTVWTAAATGISGAFAAASTAVMAFFTETIIPAFVAIGEAIADFLFAVATAEADTIFGIPLSVGTFAAAALILGAVGALAAFAFGAFAEGGVVTKPTLGLVGEAGPEAIIPLSQLGNMGGTQTIILMQDGRETTRTVLKNMPREVRLRLGNAF